MIDEILTLVMLIVLQTVLGIDNLLYISIESKNAPLEKQSYIRKLGLLLAIVFRVALLFILVKLIAFFQDPVLTFNLEGIIKANMNIHSMIVLIGGIFILYISVKEIWLMIDYDFSKILEQKQKPKTSVSSIFTMIIVMNIVFSFDSTLSAIALTDNLWIMVIGVIISGLIMVWLAESVDNFLQKNRMYEVLGLFILLIVGIMLLTEGGHLAHLYLFENEISPMNKTTFYFVIAVLFSIDIIQSKYKKNLLKKQELKQKLAIEKQK